MDVFSVCYASAPYYWLTSSQLWTPLSFSFFSSSSCPFALLRVVVVALPPLSPNQQSLLRRLFPPPLPPSLPRPPPLLRRSNAADIRPGSRPFYVNHVVKDPTPPLDLEEDRRTCRASSKGRRRGTTLKRTTALIAEEIRVPRTRCQGVYFEYRFLFSFILSSFFSSFFFFFFLSSGIFFSPRFVAPSLSFAFVYRPLWHCWPPRWYWYCGRNARQHVRNPEWRPFIDKLRAVRGPEATAAATAAVGRFMEIGY